MNHGLTLVTHRWGHDSSPYLLSPDSWRPPNLEVRCSEELCKEVEKKSLDLESLKRQRSGVMKHRVT
jgi:hypothetical protein